MSLGFPLVPNSPKPTSLQAFDHWGGVHAGFSKLMGGSSIVPVSPGGPLTRSKRNGRLCQETLINAVCTTLPQPEEVVQPEVFVSSLNW